MRCDGADVVMVGQDCAKPTKPPSTGFDVTLYKARHGPKLARLHPKDSSSKSMEGRSSELSRVLAARKSAQTVVGSTNAVHV